MQKYGNKKNKCWFTTQKHVFYFFGCKTHHLWGSPGYAGDLNTSHGFNVEPTTPRQPLELGNHTISNGPDLRLMYDANSSGVFSWEISHMHVEPRNVLRIGANCTEKTLFCWGKNPPAMWDLDVEKITCEVWTYKERMVQTRVKSHKVDIFW